MAGEIENFKGARGGAAASTRLGSRQKMTKDMLIEMEQLISTGKSPVQILWEFTQRDNISDDLKLKSVNTLVNLLYPKAASVEVKVEEEKPKDTTTLDRQIEEILKRNGIIEKDETDEEEDEAD